MTDDEISFDETDMQCRRKVIAAGASASAAGPHEVVAATAAAY